MSEHKCPGEVIARVNKIWGCGELSQHDLIACVVNALGSMSCGDCSFEFLGDSCSPPEPEPDCPVTSCGLSDGAGSRTLCGDEFAISFGCPFARG